MAVSFHGSAHCVDFRMQVLDFALLCQQNIALARQDLVNTLVLATARIPDQLPDLRWIVDGLCGLSLGEEPSMTTLATVCVPPAAIADFKASSSCAASTAGSGAPGTGAFAA